MDSQIVTLNSSNLNTEMTRNNASMIFPNRAHFISSCQVQNFLMPDSIIFYISKNPLTSKFYQKMIQSCKHFFIKNPIINFPKLYLYRKKEWYIHGSYPLKDHPNGRTIYLNELTSKIWITDLLNVYGSTSNLPVTTSFRPQIYQCDATTIFIAEQTLSFNDLMIIASECEMLHLLRAVIINNNEIHPETVEDCFETAVSLEALFKALPNLKKFIYYLPKNSSNIITTKTAEKLLKIPQFLKLDKFSIGQIPEIFDIKRFYGHIKENKKTKIEIDFSRQISDEYKTRLQTIVDEILETENRDYKVPRIGFSGITGSSRDKMCVLFYRN